MCEDEAPDVESGTLRVLLAINAAMFGVEPDLVIGAAIATLVLRGALRILRL